MQNCAETAPPTGGYRFAVSDGVNRYYVRDEEADLAERLRPLAPSGYDRIRDYGAMNSVKRWIKPWERRLQRLFRRNKRAA